jgi:hypothetical protein
MEASGQFHVPAALPPEKEPLVTHWIGGWVGPRAGLDAVMKRKIPNPCRDLNTRSSSPYPSAVPLSYPSSVMKAYREI